MINEVQKLPNYKIGDVLICIESASRAYYYRVIDLGSFELDQYAQSCEFFARTHVGYPVLFQTHHPNRSAIDETASGVYVRGLRARLATEAGVFELQVQRIEPCPI